MGPVTLPIDIMKGQKPGKIRLGAGDGTRTRDALLGRQVLYQLSYSRMRTRVISGCPHYDTTCPPLRAVLLISPRGSSSESVIL